MTQPVRYDLVDGVATITMDNPEGRNRLTVASMSLLLEFLDRAAADDAARVIVLTATGNTFCAGADMSEARSGGFAQGLDVLARVYAAMIEHPKPIIARVQGHVAGGGNGLVAASDISVAARDAKFAFTEVRVGASPAIVSVVCLMRMNRIDASELLLTGERVAAERVVKAGLVTKAVEPQDLDAAVAAYVDAFMLCGPQALASTKLLLRQVPYMGINEALEWTKSVSVERFGSSEAVEGMSAFLEKRPPAWAPQS